MYEQYAQKRSKNLNSNRCRIYFFVRIHEFLIFKKLDKAEYKGVSNISENEAENKLDQKLRFVDDRDIVFRFW